MVINLTIIQFKLRNNSILNILNDTKTFFSQSRKDGDLVIGWYSTKKIINQIEKSIPVYNKESNKVIQIDEAISRNIVGFW